MSFDPDLLDPREPGKPCLPPECDTPQVNATGSFHVYNDNYGDAWEAAKKGAAAFVGDRPHSIALHTNGQMTVAGTVLYWDTEVTWWLK